MVAIHVITNWRVVILEVHYQGLSSTESSTEARQSLEDPTVIMSVSSVTLMLAVWSCYSEVEQVSIIYTHLSENTNHNLRQIINTGLLCSFGARWHRCDQ